jgi:hypothetical protein
MTSGGMTPQQQWREVDYFPCTVLHKTWQYHLFTMLKQRVGTRAIKDKIDVLWRKYPRGLVAYLEEGKVPAGGCQMDTIFILSVLKLYWGRVVP